MVLKHKKILITELEITWEGGLVISHHLKKAKYQDLINKALVHEWKTAAIVSKDVKNNHIADKLLKCKLRLIFQLNSVNYYHFCSSRGESYD